MPHVDLLELPYFEGISIDALVSLVDLMEPEYFSANAIIMEEGQHVPPPLYIAINGRVRISKRTPDANERYLAEFDSPTLFGEIELFCQHPPVATARALTPVSTFKLTRKTFDRLFEARHEALLRFTYNVTRVVCHRLAIADEILARAAHAPTQEDLLKIQSTVFSSITSDVG